MQVSDHTRLPVAFLSHASEDKVTFAEPLARALAERGIQPWLDKWEIRPGDSLVQRLFDEGLAHVDLVVVIVSATSVTKTWVREELDSATVRRITDGTRLIPVRLDDAEIPAPLRHLAWINAQRTPKSIEQTAGTIADTVYGHDPRPAVASPPPYAATAVSVPGLTRPDTVLLTETVREAIDRQFLLGLSWVAVAVRAQEAGLSEDALEESREALAARRFVSVHLNGDFVVKYDLTRRGYTVGVPAVVPDIDAIRQRAIAILVNDPPTSFQAIDELAERADCPHLVAAEILEELNSRDLVAFTRTIGGGKISRVSPTLRRLLT